jgi:integrase
LFVLVLATGLVRGEVVGLRWGDVDLDAGEIQVRRIVSMTNGQRTETEPSPSARRTVSISERTIGLLRARREDAADAGDDVPVFEQRGGGELNPESLSLTMRRLVDRAGVTPLTMSGLRHTHATMALRAGVNPIVVSRRLGHSSYATTQNMYGHLIPPLRDHRIEELEDAIFVLHS